MIILITFFSSLIIADLKNEERYEAMKYIPINLVLSLSFFYIFSKLLLKFFGSI